MKLRISTLIIGALPALLATVISASPAGASTLNGGSGSKSAPVAIGTSETIEGVNCAIDSASGVMADWLRVHTSPGVKAPAVGQIPYHSIFRYCHGSITWAGGLPWVYGYGFNGGTRLTGWVDYEYLSGP